jgi:nickel-dependent lactate racemase
MNVDLLYGRGKMRVELPDGTHVISPGHIPGLPDEKAAFVEALRSPVGTRALRDLVPRHGICAIVVADITRPAPSHKMVPWILEECDLGPDRVVIVNGTGTHRANTVVELEGMLGPDIVRRYSVVNHNAFDPGTLVSVGRTASGNEIWVNREYAKAEFKIITGFIEPHFFAGFSGGPKGVIPAVAGIETVLNLHSARMIGHPLSTWGVLDGNPTQAEICEAALLTRPGFVANVTLNRERQITGVYAGDIIDAHRVGCRFARETAMQPVQRPFDVVVTTNAGYPLDQNLYQAVKGMSAAASIVRQGGAIIAAAECCDGLPEHGNFRTILETYAGIDQMLSAIDSASETMHDQWEAQVLGIILKKARVYLVSSLPRDEAELAFLTPVASVEEALAIERKANDGISVACLPEGPYTIPYLAQVSSGCI